MTAPWHHERNEAIANSILDEEDRVEWQRQRDVDLGLSERRPSRDEMVAFFARRHPTDAWSRDEWLAGLRWVAAVAVAQQEETEHEAGSAA